MGFSSSVYIGPFAEIIGVKKKKFNEFEDEYEHSLDKFSDSLSDFPLIPNTGGVGRHKDCNRFSTWLVDNISPQSIEEEIEQFNEQFSEELVYLRTISKSVVVKWGVMTHAT